MTVARTDIDYDTRIDHEARLRKVVLYSADVLPREVTTYLEELAEENRRGARDHVLKTFEPLVDHLAAAFVTFAFQQLIRQPSEADGSNDSLGDFGIGGWDLYSPPAHVQGPFLRLLRMNEDQGLRLVHGLTNAATQNWRTRELAGRNQGIARTPVPIMVDFGKGPRKFWGNDELYRWHRQTGLGPSAVISALMALEFWMEEQLAAGRDSGNLLKAVLGESESVAVIGVCVSVSLADPQSCLVGVLPLLSDPRVWLYDAERARQDSQRRPFVHSLGRHEFINQVVRERDHRPQRRQVLTELVRVALFSGDTVIQAAFDRAFRGFGNETPFQFEEERAQPEAEQLGQALVEECREHLERANYQATEPDRGVPWRFQSPHEPMLNTHPQPVSDMHANCGLELWATARAVLNASDLPDTEMLSRIVRAAKGLEEDDRIDADSLPNSAYRKPSEQAVSEVAAVVVCRGLGWAQRYGHFEWARSAVLTAASLSGCQHTAVRGLTALICLDAADGEIRNTVLRLAMLADLDVVQALFHGLRPAWGRDPVLCWNCLDVALSLAVCPREHVIPGQGLELNEAGSKWVSGLWERHRANLTSAKLPCHLDIDLGRQHYFDWAKIKHLLHEIPFADMIRDSMSAAKLLATIDSVFDWTVVENIRLNVDNHRSYETPPQAWNRYLTGWLSRLSCHLDSEVVDRHIISPVLAAWNHTPDLTSGLLHGLVEHRLDLTDALPHEVIGVWERTCRGVLAVQEVARYTNCEYMPDDWSHSVTMIVFVDHEVCVFNGTWPHVGLFANLIDEWVERIGTNHEAYSALLTLHKSHGPRLPISKILGWLNLAAGRSANVDSLWRSKNNGMRTAEILNMIWRRNRLEITKGGEEGEQFWRLVDHLAARGVSLASVIIQDMEHEDRH